MFSKHSVQHHRANTDTPSAGRRAPVLGTVVSVSCRQQGVDAAQGKAAKGTSSKPATTANRRGKSRGDEGQLNRTPLRHSDASVCVSRKNSSSSGLSPNWGLHRRFERVALQSGAQRGFIREIVALLTKFVLGTVIIANIVMIVHTSYSYTNTK